MGIDFARAIALNSDVYRGDGIYVRWVHFVYMTTTLFQDVDGFVSVCPLGRRGLASGRCMCVHSSRRRRPTPAPRQQLRQRGVFFALGQHERGLFATIDRIMVISPDQHIPSPQPISQAIRNRPVIPCPHLLLVRSGRPGRAR